MIRLLGIFNKQMALMKFLLIWAKQYYFVNRKSAQMGFVFCTFKFVIVKTEKIDGRLRPAIAVILSASL